MSIGGTKVYHIVYIACYTMYAVLMNCLFSLLCVCASSDGEWRDGLPLLGSVWWTRWLRCSCYGLQTAPSAHCGAAAGDFGCSAQPGITATYCNGRWPGSYQYPLHASSPIKSILPAQLAVYYCATLFHWEEDPAWEPCDRCPRECLQTHGEDCLGLVHCTVLKPIECCFSSTSLTERKQYSI